MRRGIITIIIIIIIAAASSPPSPLLPVLGAVSQSLAVSASDCAILPEVSGGAALLCPPSSPAAWAENRHRLKRDIELPQRLVCDGLRRASDYSWEKSAKTVLELARKRCVT